MGVGTMSTSPGGAPTIRRLHLHFPGHEPVQAPARPRGYFGAIDVAGTVESVRLSVEVDPPAASVCVNDLAAEPVELTSPVRLSLGRNVFRIAVTDRASGAESTYELRIYRRLPQEGWQRLAASSPWAARDSAGELVHRGRMWLIGGFTPPPAADVWSSADGVAWTRHADIPTGAGVDIPVAFVLNERMWVTDMVGALYSSADGEHWAEEPRPPLHRRRHAGGVVLNGRVYVMGGTGGGQLLNDVWSSADGRRWTQETAAAPWCGRMIHHSPLALDGRMWLLGGGALGSDYHPFVAWNDVWSSADGRHWEQVLEHAPWQPRIWGSAAVYRDRLWLLGGFRSEPTWENLGDAWYSADGRDWHQFAVQPTVHHSGAANAAHSSDDHVWAPRHEHSVYALGGSLYVVGGMVWPLVSDIWCLTLPGLAFVTQPPLETYCGADYEYPARADFHRSRAPQAYTLQEGPSWLNLDPHAGRLWGRPDAPGEDTVSLRVSEPGGEAAVQKFTVHVLPFR